MTGACPTLGLIDRALAMTDERTAAIGPSSLDPMSGSIRSQLVFMRAVVVADRAATTDELNRLTLGVIAIREFEADDEDYCDALTKALHAFKQRQWQGR